MTYAIKAALQISADNITWYSLTDHNRAPIVYTPQRLEQVQRMADGTMRKFVVANKDVFDVSWSFIPAASTTLGTGNAAFKPTVDGNYGAAFMKAFYEQYVFTPVYLKILYANDNATGTAFNSSQTQSNTGTGIDTIQVFMTDFSMTIINRFTYTDYVDVKMQFTEV
jgi:hypothetical protein